ncbi:MAG: FAD-dependent oxidoreductase [Synergistaceae bacterium]|nr:FAD-dependent oxidoreductase [Synergistaceae bacterium]
MKKYPHLFSPRKIGPLMFKNRMATAPMSCSDLSPEGYLTPENIAFYKRKARGGVACVTLGESLVDSVRGKAHGRMLALDDVEILPSLIDCTDAIKQFNAFSSIELIHAGARARPEYCASGPIGPSRTMGIYGEEVAEMTEADIEEAAEQFGKAAFMAKCGGVDMCMVHGGHGWLISQFLSPANNKRTDKYGGSIENRMRFPLMVIENIRKRCGPNFPIEFRLSGSEFFEGGLKAEDNVEIAKLLDGKVDIIHVSSGSFHVPKTSLHMFPSVFLPHGSNLPLAEAIKKVVSTTVATVGGFSDPALMEEALRDGKTDLIYIGRGVVADPDIPVKTKNGREDEIVHCLRCNVCLSLSFVPHVPFAVRVLRCSVNPVVGREFESQFVEKPTSAKRVLIAGGGPGGIQAAITASERGHEVILCEKSDRLGGALKHADGAPFKEDLKIYRDSIIARLGRGAVKVLLNTEVTPELAERLHPDVIIASIGATPIIPAIPGVDGKNVVLATDLYNPDVKIGKKVVVIGGGLIGCEEGLNLAMRGHDVSIIEMRDSLAPEAYFLHRLAVTEELSKYAHVELGTSCKKITGSGVVVSDSSSSERVIDADTIVIAVGLKPLTDEAWKLRDCAPDFITIGDCGKIGLVLEAVRGGYDAGISI